MPYVTSLPLMMELMRRLSILNFQHLLILDQSKLIPKEITRCFPWVIWYMCKNINYFLFEGRSTLANELVNKTIDEVELWKKRTKKNIQKEISCKRWTAPKPLWVKCNTGNPPTEEEEVFRF